MIDICLHAPTLEALAADLEAVGLAVDGALVEASARHALTAWTAGAGAYALVRCLDDALAVTIAGATFAGGTAIVDRPEGAPVFAGGEVQDLGAAKAAARAAIDAEAERRRQLVLTPGEGQALEYQHTAEEASRAIAEVDPLPAAYPFLAAEQAALAATVGAVDLRDVAEAVLADRAAWLVYGAAIKAVRRRAKLEIGAATSSAGVAAVLAGVAWPEVSGA